MIKQRQVQQKKMTAENKRSIAMNIGLFFLLAALFIGAMCLGKYPVTPLDGLRALLGSSNPEDPMASNVITGLRLPRLLASMLCGAALALSGAVYQGAFQNPLVSPDFLGVSQGACVGAAIAILSGMGAGATQLFAFLGGLVAVFITLFIPFAMRNRSNIVLVLSGIIVGGAMSAVLGFLKYIADPATELASITFWQMGSFSYVTMHSLAKIMPVTIFPAILIILLSWRIDLLSLGEAEASTLGVNIPFMRMVLIVCSTFLTASAVCIAGTIGWVGLVIPHLGRMLVGSSHARLLPSTLLVGAIFMLVVDTCTRLIGPAEMPISILTGILGAPFYAWLLYKRRSVM